MSFCTTTLTTHPSLRLQHGVLRASALALTSAAVLLSEQILERARHDAALITAAADDQARRREAEQDGVLLARAAALTEGVERERGQLREQTAPLALALAQSLFEQLLLAVPAAERMAAVLARLQRETPTELAGALLWVHPSDAADLPALPWPVKHDPAQARGSARLEALSGLWRVDFSDALAAVHAVFGERMTAVVQGTEVPAVSLIEVCGAAAIDQENEHG